MKVVAYLCLCMILLLCSCTQNIIYPNCRKNIDCIINKEGMYYKELCVSGICKECISDSNCQVGSICNNNKCIISLLFNSSYVLYNYCGGVFHLLKYKLENNCDFDRYYIAEGNIFTISKDLDSCVYDRENFFDKSLYCSLVRIIFFDYNKFNLTKNDIYVLNSILECSIKDLSINFIIEGHCDLEGTVEYNLALGKKRALSVYNYLMKIGIAEDRMKIISYGKDKPLISKEKILSYSKNRRTVIRIIYD